MDRKFHPCALAVTKNEATEDFRFLFETVKGAVLQETGTEYRPTALVADSADQITKAFEEVFGSDSYERIHCYAHVIRNIDKKLKFTSEILWDGYLDTSEFGELCRALFRNYLDQPYPIDAKSLREMFNTFDINQDGHIDAKEFELCWEKWIKKIVRPVSALVVVDVQNDFISGSLAISNCPARHNGEEVVEPINRLLDTVEFDCVYYSLDWHPENHVSFIDNVTQRKLHESSEVQCAGNAKTYDTVVFEGPPPFSQKLWPRHCVQNSWGAKLHENLRVVEGSSFIYKGTNPEVDSYSAFLDNSKQSATALVTELKNKGVTDCYICGIATDFCVGHTAFHSIELGYRTILIADASRGITLEDIQNTKDKIINGHGAIITSDEVNAMVQGRDRRPELGVKLALELRKQIENDKKNY